MRVRMRGGGGVGVGCLTVARSGELGGAVVGLRVDGFPSPAPGLTRVGRAGAS